MLTDFLRDQAFAVAWLSMMAAAWLGWSQEDPKPRLRGALGTGSVLGMLIAIAAGLLVWRNWTTPTALEGRYWVFGLIVLAEAVLIGVGCIFLARRGLTRWYGWWIGICVALHFIPPGMDIRRLVLPCARCCSSRRSRHHVSTSEAWYVCDQPLGMPLDCFDVSRLRDCVRNHLATSLRIPRVRQSCTRKCARRLLRLQPTFQLRIPQDRR